jgi:ABC-type branched-subunit amino acid transport system permease subunit
MKNIGFMAVAAVVSGIITTYLTAPPGMQSWLVIAGTVAAIAGSAVGILVHQSATWVKVLLVIVALGVCVYAINDFRSITGGEPGREAANMLLFWTAAIFAPVGFLIELAGLKITDK